MSWIDIKDGKTLVEVNPKFYRPAEVDLLIGDYSRAERILGGDLNIPRGVMLYDG